MPGEFDFIDSLGSQHKFTPISQYDDVTDRASISQSVVV
jgi:hypothetical protein